MSEKFIEINKEFNKTKRDLQFSVNELNNLTSEEREIIESKIINCVKLGDNTSYKYIKALIKIDPEEYITGGDLKKLPVYDQAQIYFSLYERTNNDYYIEKITELATNSIEVYGLLSFIYIKDQIKTFKREDIYSEIIRISRNDDEKFKQLYEKFKPQISLNVPKENPLNAIIGFAVGDALGVPVEFTSREERKKHSVTEMLGNGVHKVPAGTWSDDTSMTLATMDSISNKKEVNYDDIMKRFCSWFTKSEYTATDNIFDIGMTTRKGLINYMNGTNALECGSSNVKDNGNGSLMRMAPIAYYLSINDFSDEQETEIINNISSLTHAHEISKLGCKIYVDYLKQLIKNKTKEEAYEYIKNKDYEKSYSKETVDVYSRILKDNIKTLSEEKISSSGYVLSTLEASLWCTLNSNSYEEAVEKAISLGEDTDTVGAITGSLNGVIYGINNIPQRWKNALLKKDYLEEKSKDFTLALHSLKQETKKRRLHQGYLDRMLEDGFHANRKVETSEKNI